MRALTGWGLAVAAAAVTAWLLQPTGPPGGLSARVAPAPVTPDRERLAAELEASLGRPPGAAELAAAVEREEDLELLVTEARRLGLDRTDRHVRERLGRLAVWVLQGVQEPPEPPEEALRELYVAAAQDLTLDTRVTLRQVYAPTEAEAVDLRERWLGGEDPRGLGEAPPGGPVLRGRTPERLAELFGLEFAARLRELPPETPTVVRSSLGWHVVAVLEWREGVTPSFEQARERLVVRWKTAWTERATREALGALEAR